MKNLKADLSQYLLELVISHVLNDKFCCVCVVLSVVVSGLKARLGQDLNRFLFAYSLYVFKSEKNI